MRWLDGLLGTMTLLVCCSLAAASSGPEEPGRVQIPLDAYNQLVASASDAAGHPRRAPASYALGSARVAVVVSDGDPPATGSIEVELTLEVLEDEWTLIPVLPAGTPVQRALVEEQPVQLIASPLGLCWSTRKAGKYLMKLSYRFDALHSEGGFSLPVPLPAAAAIALEARLPGTGLDATVIPSAGSRITVDGHSTTITATIPTTSGVQISWRSADTPGYAVSRAGYRGRLVGDAVAWTAEMGVELFTDGPVTLPVLTRSVALSALAIDGEPSPILVDGAHFATRIRGRGLHTVTLEFEVQVDRTEGPPRVALHIPQIPVSRFDLTLPGKKELTVSPASNVSHTTDDEETTATVHVPMTSQVTFGWSEAVPEAIRAEVRTNATAFHTVFAEEGVLNVSVMLLFEVTRGETNVIELLLPGEVQVNRIGDVSGAVTDWRLGEPDDAGRRQLTIFLDRQLRGELLLDVHYDRSLLAADGPSFEIPLLWAAGTQRQRGMLALLANSELTLNPVEESSLTKVGENQLPAFVREAVSLTVAHTYKYAETLPRLVVEPSAPERVQGKFDARVDTLISLGDVTLTGSATVEIHVKSGQIMELGLLLPEGLNLLSLTAPSLRTHRLVDTADGQAIELEFTQDMEGQFRLELTYERITVDGEQRVEVPTASVPGAEVEQGRIAVEALSAVEVKPETVEQLTSLDVAELPRQLVLRTTNPILLAYKYVHADPPHRLALDVTRHPLLEVQEAAIDQAHYRSLFTRDGLLVTTARFTVRNSRKQFLRVELPDGAEVWSTFVDGHPEQPAVAQSDAGTPSVLIKILNSTEGFPVELVFATNGPRIGGLGRVEATLPRPDILVTRSRWDVYLPDGMRYGEPTGNLDPVAQAQLLSVADMNAQLRELERAVAPQAVRPLEISVPTAGVHFAFEKLYANQGGQIARFTIPYASRRGALVGQAASLAGVALFWWGVGLYLRGGQRLVGPAVSTVGIAVVAVAVGVYHLGATLPFAAFLAAGLLVALYRLRPQALAPVESDA